MPGPGRGPPGPSERCGNVPGPGRGPPAAGIPGRGIPGRGGMPGPAAGRAGIPAGEPGRDGIPGVMPGRAAGGRGGIARPPPSAGVEKGLLPTRGPAAAAGRAGIAVPPSSAAGASGAAAGASSTGAVPGELTGAAFGAALVAFLGAGAGAGAAAGKASRSLRATGASMVEEADLTNSPFSFNQARTFLLSRPSSFASSWTRALPGTGLLLRPGRSLASVLLHGRAHLFS